jgi:hypothetical protein
MALFSEYTKPGVYVRDSVEDAGIPLFGSVRIPVLIGEGEETRTRTGISLHRGSSNYSDELAVREDLTAQVDGISRKFSLRFFPVVTGDGKGTITNDPADIKVFASGIPILVSFLDGSLHEFMTQQILPLGTELKVDYYFKRMDTLISNEDLSNQVPAFASLAISAGKILVSPSVPGNLGNLVSIELKSSALGEGVMDSLAVSGIGTDSIVVELRKENDSLRSNAEVALLLSTSVITASAGSLSAVVLNSADEASIAAVSPVANMIGGSGPNTNKTFKLHNVPVVDGSNGGVVTTDPSNITVLVNDLKVRVVSIDGLHGLFTLASAVPFGSVLKVSYYTNTYQDTFDVLPGDNIVELTRVGFGVGRNDFIDGVDFVLDMQEQNAVIQWGASASVKTGEFTAGFTPFDASVVTPVLVDEYVFLRPVSGLVNGKNFSFVLEDVPTDGSMLSKPTNDPSKVAVYCGTNPVEALENGPIRVVGLNGANKTITLYNAPATGKLFASYYRNVLNDHTYTLSVSNPGVTGQGTFTITDEMGNKAPIASQGVHNVEQAGNFLSTGIVWPFNFSDLRGQVGATPDEVITLTFQNDGDEVVQGVDVQAHVEFGDLSFRADNAGIAPNGITSIALVMAEASDASAIRKPVLASKAISSIADNGDGNLLFTAASHGLVLHDLVEISNTLHYDGYGFEVTGVPSPDQFLVAGTFTAPDSGVISLFEDHSLVIPGAVLATAPVHGLTSGEEVILGGNLSYAGNQLIEVVDADHFYFMGTFVDGNAGTWSKLSETGDVAKIDLTSEAISVLIQHVGGVVRNLSEVSTLFTPSSPLSETPLAGKIHCSFTGTGTASAAAAPASFLVGGVLATHIPYANRFRVTSSRTTADMAADFMGRTGGAETPVLPNIGGSAVGLEGFIGQTFIDASTGVKFTIVDPEVNVLLNPEYGLTSAPSPSYFFQPGDVIKFTMNSGVARRTSAIPTIDLPGLRLLVTSTYGMKSGDSAIVQTYNKQGAEPAIGEFYYVDYKVAKTDKDFGIKLFTNIQDVYAEYGQPNATNKLSLAARLFSQNGGQILGCVQVPKEVGMEIASDQAFMSAISSLAQPLPGSEDKASIIVPLSTSAVVQQHLNRHLITQASQRMCGEAMGYIGFGLNDTPNMARERCRAIRSERMIAAFPGGAILTLEIGGKSAEFAVGGEFIAAAMAGMDANPAYDVATSLTRKNIVGFDRLIRRYDDLVMDMGAADGVCWLGSVMVLFRSVTT